MLHQAKFCVGRCHCASHKKLGALCCAANLKILNDSIDSEHVDMIYAFHLMRWKGGGIFAVLSSHMHICKLHSDAVVTYA